MLRKHYSLEKFFPDNSCSFEIVSQANSISGGFNILKHHQGLQWTFSAAGGWCLIQCCLRWLLPQPNKKPQRKRETHFLCECSYRQVFVNVSAREEKKPELLQYFRNCAACLNTAKPFRKRSVVGTIRSIAAHSGEDPAGQPPGTNTGKVIWNLEDERGDPDLRASSRRTTSQKANKSHSCSLHRCSQLLR